MKRAAEDDIAPSDRIAVQVRVDGVEILVRDGFATRLAPLQAAIDEHVAAAARDVATPLAVTTISVGGVHVTPSAQNRVGRDPILITCNTGTEPIMLARLSARMDALEASNAALTVDNAILKTRIIALEDDNAALKTRVTTLEAEGVRMKRAIGSLGASQIDIVAVEILIQASGFDSDQEGFDTAARRFLAARPGLEARMRAACGSRDIDALARALRRVHRSRNADVHPSRSDLLAKARECADYIAEYAIGNRESNFVVAHADEFFDT